MEPAVFEIDRTKKGGQALYELLRSSTYAKLVNHIHGSKKIREYTFDALSEATKKAFADADAGITHTSRDIDDLFGQLGI